ncbi:S-layer homology domain-containing protein [Pseudoflavonifractor phocaeensis]|uniref:S-layer homology domain-containing protein n=1 Tax=Pseudoflavonifractor phocaeensis TaxID=1870988 RepID=UPI00195BED6C|nr:S-layer homology domain-containing protein [Pseudoflavonifractor phocaeensis]MBM6924818.1 S-layer homology domain-containing protein [Pseudoflavonifractor phocaeensis]
MRNLKRVLSLALAAMMLMGMMVVGASAANLDFTDSDEIKNTEAVEVMVALNVFNGKEDGSTFDPAGTLTREEMSKIIAYVMNGGVEPVLGVKEVPTYSDIDGIWSEKYIEYATSMGIIAGDGSGKFNPKDTLTGEQAAKMLLTAMGYNANVFGFVGNSWSTNVNRYANEAGLYKDLGNLDPSAPISRDDACQLAYNAIQATMMKRTWGQDLATGEVSETYVPWTVENPVTGISTGWSLLNDKFDGTIKLGYLGGFDYDENKGQWTYYFYNGNEYGGNAISAQKAIDNGTALNSTVDYTGFYGQQVKVIYNVEDDDVVYGVYANDSSVIATGATGDIVDNAIDNTAKTIKLDGTTYKLGDVSGRIGVYDTENNQVADAALTALAGDHSSAYTFKLVDNTGDGKIDAVIRTPMRVAKLNYIGTSTINFGANINNLTTEDIVIYDGYAAGDWVYYTNSAFSTTRQDTIEKAELKTAVVDGVRGDNDVDTYVDYQLDGKWYGKTTDNDGIYTVNDAEVDDTIEYVTLGSTVFYAKIVDVGATTKNVAMVITADTVDPEADNLGNNTIKAKLLFADGTKSTVTISKMNGKTPDVADDDANDVSFRVGKLVTYRLDGSDYELTDVSKDNLAGHKGFEDNDVAYNNEKIGTSELADDAVVYVLKGAVATASANNDGKVYTGRELKNAYGSDAFGGNGQVLTNKVDGFTYGMTAVLCNDNFPTINTGSYYGYLVAATSRSANADNKTELTFSIWTKDNELMVAKMESTDAPSDYPRGSVITYDVVSDGVIKNVSLVNVTTAVVSGWNEAEGKIQFANGAVASSKVDDDTTVIYVDSSKMEGAEGGVIRIADNTHNPAADVIDANDQANVRYYGSSTVLDLLVVDINNNMAPNPAAGLVDANLNGETATDDDIKNALKSDAETVVLSAKKEGLTLDGVNIPEDKTLAVAGTVTLKNSQINGVLDVDSATAVTLDKVTVAGSADLSGVDTAFKDIVTVAKGGTVKLDANTEADTGHIPTGTLTVDAGGTLKSVDTSNTATNGEEVIFVGPTADARIQTVKGTSVVIEFVNKHGSDNRHKMTINGSATIPAGETWWAMFDSSIKDDEGTEVSNAQGIDMTLASGTLTVNGTLNLSSASKTGSSLTVAKGAGVVVNGTVVIAAKGTLTVDGTFTGTEGAVLKVTKGATITGVDGVDGSADKTYTCDKNGKWTAAVQP